MSITFSVNAWSLFTSAAKFDKISTKWRMISSKDSVEFETSTLNEPPAAGSDEPISTDYHFFTTETSLK